MYIYTGDGKRRQTRRLQYPRYRSPNGAEAFDKGRILGRYQSGMDQIKGTARAMAQHDILARSLKQVAEDAEDENGGWKIKLIIFVGGTSGSVHAQTLNDNLKELQVIESKRNAIRKGLVYELLNAQDTVLCSYFAQRSGDRNEWQNQVGVAEEVFQGLGNFE